MSRRRQRRASDVATVTSDLLARRAKRLRTLRNAVVETGDATAVHRSRVAIRRLRAELRLLRPFLDRDRTQRIEQDLKWWGGLLGDLRDLHVVGQRLMAELPDSSRGRSAGAEFQRLLDEQRKFRHGLLVSAMGSNRAQELIGELSTVADRPPWRAGVDPTCRAGPVLRRTSKRASRRARRHLARLGDAASDLELHALRKDVKEALYAAQAAQRAGVVSQQYVRKLRSVKERLGELQDCVIALGWLERNVERFSPPTAYVAGLVHQRLEERYCAARRAAIEAELPAHP